MARNSTNLDKSIRFFWILLVSAKNAATYGMSSSHVWYELFPRVGKAFPMRGKNIKQGGCAFHLDIASLLTCANLNLRVRFDDAKIHISCESAQYPSALYNTQRSPGHHGQGSALLCLRMRID